MTALVFTAVVAIAAPSPAHAEGYVSPWAGVNFGSQIDNGRGSFGVDAGGMGAGIIGGEIAFGYSPSFFGSQNDFGDNTVIDLMANLIVGIPFGGTRGAGFRPFVTGGAGLVRTQVDDNTVTSVSSSDNMPGWNLGAGVMGYFNDHVGLRGDVKYIRSWKDLNTGDVRIDVSAGQLHYWRTAIGVVIR
ncbi:MAG: outer membrane beta-barrel protein [Acidobacteria bacterium]|nr:outer membrane beta-barrel protein [Acidobacteriota bacterium]